MAFSQCVGPQDIKGQCWTDEESDGENESEQFLYGIQVQLQYIVMFDLVFDDTDIVFSVLMLVCVVIILQ